MASAPNNFFSRYVRWSCLSALAGILAGAAATLFLISLDEVTRVRNSHPALIWALPLGGLFVGLIYHYLGKDIAAGNNLILDEIHDPKRVVPFRMAPLVFLGTVVTQLFGGSAGREGAVVQMGASLSDQLTKVFRIEHNERRILLMAGASAGFGAAIGTPWAGMIFGMEVLYVGRFKFFAWFECFLASFVGFNTAKFLGAPHAAYASVPLPGWDIRTLAYLTLAGLAFGLAARVFAASTHIVERAVNRWIPYSPLKPFLGGAVLAILFYLEGSYRYVGLGTPYIQEAFETAVSFRDPLLKSIFTSLTVGTGFKGGEFVPLVFIGTTLGSALSTILPLAMGLLASVGFAAVFGAAANTPLACTIMAMELFGARIGPYAFVGCFVAYLVSGQHGIYRSQKHFTKPHLNRS